MINEQTSEAQSAAAARLLADKDLNGSAPHDDRSPQNLHDITSAAAKAARDYHSRMLENMKVSINAALDYANGLASASLTPDLGGEGADRPRQQEKDGGMPKPEGQLPPLVKVAEEYRTKAFELMTANVNATLDYAQQLAGVKSLPEFIELSSKHARKHFELMMTEAAALGTLSRSLTASNAQQMTASIAKALGQKKA